MIRSLLNWRSLLALIAISIVTGTVFYSQYLAKKIAAEEKLKVEQWVAASKSILNNPEINLDLPNLIRNEQQSIPIIETTEQDSITNYINLDSTKIARNPRYLYKKLEEFRSENSPLVFKVSDTPYIANRYYYGHTVLLDEIRYYPLIQLLIVAMFIFFTLYSVTVRNRATQNQLWAGMAKETAHQLGTPVSSLQGWIEMLKESNTDPATVQEIQKDVDRLKLVSDRFGKIGSKPRLEQQDLVVQVKNMMEYIRKRSPGKVVFTMKVYKDGRVYEPSPTPTSANTTLTAATGSVPETILADISSPLFDWVIENLLKNALDAMDGKGTIGIEMREQGAEICIDITDSGKGIAKKNVPKVFKPGFTTKKRGWGLGLSLSKRIIEQYHKGQLFVKQSEIGKGTTFRILLKK